MRPDLTLQQLRVVLAVHEAGSFTVAAKRLLVAQSSLSRTVAEVERRLGTPLFERTTRRLEPTPAGRELAAAARRAVDAVEAELRHVEGYLAGRRGRVRIATLPSLAAILLPGVVSAFRRDHPEVEMSIEDALSDEVLQRVRGGLVDLAVTVVSAAPDPQVPPAGSPPHISTAQLPAGRTGEPPEYVQYEGRLAGTPSENLDPPIYAPDSRRGALADLTVTPVATDRFCCVVPPGHRFAGRDVLSWRELAGEAFIAFDRTTSIRQHVDASLAAAGVVPRQVVAARNIAAVAGLVAADLGVSVVPGLVLPLMGFAGVRHVVLDEPAAHRTMAVVRAAARPLSPIAAAFVAALTDPARARPVLPAQARWLDPHPDAKRPGLRGGRAGPP